MQKENVKKAATTEFEDHHLRLDLGSLHHSYDSRDLGNGVSSNCPESNESLNVLQDCSNTLAPDDTLDMKKAEQLSRVHSDIHKYYVVNDHNLSYVMFS